MPQGRNLPSNILDYFTLDKHLDRVPHGCMRKFNYSKSEDFLRKYRLLPDRFLLL